MSKQIKFNYKDNPNIIPKKNCSVRLFKDVASLHCLGYHLMEEPSHELPLDTKKKFFLMNSNGWGYCEDHVAKEAENAEFFQE